jgi:FKBP-type peptidyl-prolyl cis-trans isomerase
MRNILIVLGVLVMILIIGGVMVLSGATGGGAGASPSPSSTPKITQTAVSKDLQITDITVGTGAEAVAGKKISVNYIGTLADGTKFDSSYDRNQPFEFTLGTGQVIAGWDQGVAGMKVGGKRKLVIPPSLGYGAQANGSIPANSTLTFEVELVAVQ